MTFDIFHVDDMSHSSPWRALKMNFKHRLEELRSDSLLEERYLPVISEDGTLAISKQITKTASGRMLESAEPEAQVGGRLGEFAFILSGEEEDFRPVIFKVMPHASITSSANVTNYFRCPKTGAVHETKKRIIGGAVVSIHEKDVDTLVEEEGLVPIVKDNPKHALMHEFLSGVRQWLKEEHYQAVRNTRGEEFLTHISVRFLKYQTKSGVSGWQATDWHVDGPQVGLGQFREDGQWRGGEDMETPRGLGVVRPGEYDVEDVAEDCINTRVVGTLRGCGTLFSRDGDMVKAEDGNKAESAIFDKYVPKERFPFSSSEAIATVSALRDEKTGDVNAKFLWHAAPNAGHPVPRGEKKDYRALLIVNHLCKDPEHAFVKNPVAQEKTRFSDWTFV